MTPPLPPAPSLARINMNEKVAVEGEVSGGASSAGIKSAGAAASSTKAMTILASAGGAAALPAGDPPGQMRTSAGQQDGGSFMAAAARMEWIERRGNNDGVVDMEVGCVGGLQASHKYCTVHVAGAGERWQWENRGLAARSSLHAFFCILRSML